MNLLHRLPSKLQTGGLVIGIRTGAAFWIWLTARLREVDEKKGLCLLEQAIESIERRGESVSAADLTPQEAGAVFERVGWFMRGGVDEAPQARSDKKKPERLLDYERDLDALYAAFLQSYGLDLYAEEGGGPLLMRLHWWRFLALANNLPAGSQLVDYYMHYRGLDASKLPRKTDADRQYARSIIAIKRQVSLDAPRPSQGVKAEKWYQRRLRELQGQGGGNVER